MYRVEASSARIKRELRSIPLHDRERVIKVIEALKDGGLRDRVKVLIGGAAVSDEYAQEIGADAYCVDGFHAIKVLDSFQRAKSN